MGRRTGRALRGRDPREDRAEGHGQASRVPWLPEGAEARPAVGGLEGRRRQGRESTISRVCTEWDGGEKVFGGARGLFPGAHAWSRLRCSSKSGMHAVAAGFDTLRFSWDLWAVQNLLEGKGIGLKSTGDEC